MATPAVYCLSGLENTKIVISQDELRDLFGQVETEFSQSEIYQRAVGGLQKRLGHASINVQLLIKALGREAIRLALRQVVQQFQVEETVDCAAASMHSNTVHSEAHSESSGSNSKLFGSEGIDNFNDDKALPQEIAVAEPSSTPSTTPLPDDALQDAGESSNGQVASSPLPSDSKYHPHCNRLLNVSERAKEEKSMSDRQRSDTGLRKSAVPVSSRSVQRPQAQKSPNQLARHEALQHIGRQLQQARTHKSWSIYDIHQLTRVPLHQIQSLELGQIDYLPEDIYVRGFIRRIAEALDLNSAALLETLPRPTQEANLLPTWHAPTPGSDRSDKTTRSLKSPQQLRPVHLYLGYAVLMSGAAGGLTWVAQQPLEGFNLETLPAVPEFVEDLAPIQIFKQEMRNLSQRQTQSGSSGAIAQPETIPVESSTDTSAPMQ